jgi:hypothetical protein
VVQHATYRTAADSSVYQLLKHDEEPDMIGYKLLIFIVAILITGCEALVFIGATAGLN